MWCLQTSTQHQDDLSYFSKRWFVCVAKDKENTIDFYLLETISDPLSSSDELFWIDKIALFPLSLILPLRAD